MRTVAFFYQGFQKASAALWAEGQKQSGVLVNMTMLVSSPTFSINLPSNSLPAGFCVGTCELSPYSLQEWPGPITCLHLSD